MHRQRRKRKIVLVFLLIVLVFMGIGYSAFSSNLRITGNTKITSDWDVEITGISAPTINGSAEEESVPTYDKLSANINVNLYEPGDSVEYDVTISNLGTIDATLDNYTLGTSTDSMIVTFSNFTKGEILYKKGHSNSTKDVHVKVEYNPEYSGGEISEETSINFLFKQPEVKELTNDEVVSKDKYLVTYDCTTNGGSSCTEFNEYLLPNSSVDLTKTPSIDGYNFIGWNTNPQAEEGLSSYTMPSNNTTLYAILEATDQTPPVIDNVSTTKTANSITVVAIAHDDETGISKYEFSSDNGNTWTSNGTNETYTFTNLTMGQTYNIKVRVTNGVNDKTTSDAIEVTTGISAATFIENVSQYKTTVEITYPEGCSNGTYTCTYKKNNETAVTVNSSNLTDNKINVEFTDSGTLVATVSDGTNTVSSSYTVSMQQAPITPGVTISKLGQNVVTSGDGLYDGGDGTYIYRGANPNNYITLGSDTYRIMSIDTSGNLKVIKDTPLTSMPWDPGYSTSISGITDASSTEGTRYSSTSTDYCYVSSASSYYGCKSWGSKTSTLNSAGTSTVTQMPWEAGSSTLYTLPTYDSYVNVYLNGGTYPTTSGTTTLTSWYSSNVASNLQSKIVNHLWNVGPIKYNNSGIATDISQASAYKWRGKIGLMNPIDYVRASTNSACTNVYQYYDKSSCYNNGSTHNWLYKSSSQWIMAPRSDSNARLVWSVGSADLNYGYARNSYGVRPVLYLSSCINLTGSGTSDDAFQIVDDATCTASSSQTIPVNDKDSQRPTLSTTNTTNSITAVLNTSNVTGEITKYEFSKDNGVTWQQSNNSTYVFSSLTTNTYRVIGRVITSNNVALSSDKSIVTLNEIETPEFEADYKKENGNIVGDITITYPEGCGSTFTCTYTKDSNSPVTVTSTTAVVHYSADGELAASVSDGINTSSSSFTVTLPEVIDMSGVEVMTVNSGDGLYVDGNTTDDTAYFYRGANPNNYITLGSDTYRIMSIDTSGNLKVIKDTPLTSMPWDPGYSTSISGITDASSTEGTRYSSTSTDYCYVSSAYSYYGCKSWGSKTSTLNSPGTSTVTQMPWEAGSSTLKNLPTYDSYINVYLNGGTYPTTSGTTTLTSWYSSNVASNLQSKIVNHLWNVGPIKYNNSGIATDISQASAYKWRGKIGLMNPIDYVRASTNSACTNVYKYYNNSSCYNNSSTHNWLYKNANQWTMAPYSRSDASYVWNASSRGSLSYNNALATYGVRPVLYLSSNISLSGSGTSSEPYLINPDPPTNSLCVSRTYTGSSQQLTSITSTDEYTLSGYSQTDAGTYTITAALNSGYKWSDGTTENKTFTCSIAKANPTIDLSATSGTVVAGKTMTFTESANVNGIFENTSNSTEVATVSPAASSSEIAANSAQTTTITGEASGSATITVNFTPTDTENYNTTSKTYAATITKSAVPPTNSLCVARTYTGSAQQITSATSGTGYTLSGYSQTKAGSHTVTATLASGYRWNDNSTGTKTFACSIAKANPTITLSATSGTVVAGKTMTFTEKANVKGKFANTSASTGVATVSPAASSSEIAANSAQTVTVTGKASGSAKLTVKFTPTDTTNYNTVSKTYTATITKSATIPTNSLCVARVYTGSNQNLTSATSGTGYTLSGYSQKNSGEYTITATLASGYRWSDNATGTKTFKCTITSISYSVYQNGAWTSYAENGAAAGVTGKSLPILGIKIKLNYPGRFTGSVQYKPYIQSTGWASSYVADNTQAGNISGGKRLEAIKIKLTSNAASAFDIYYSVHAQTYDWLDWAKNDGTAGTTDLAKRLESIKIKLVPKGGSAPGATTKPYIAG